MRAQDFLQMIALFRQLILLTFDAHFFELGQMPQFQLKDGFGLHIAKAKTQHQLGFRLFFVANNADDFIDI